MSWSICSGSSILLVLSPNSFYSPRIFSRHSSSLDISSLMLRVMILNILGKMLTMVRLYFWVPRVNGVQIHWNHFHIHLPIVLIIRFSSTGQIDHLKIIRIWLHRMQKKPLKKQQHKKRKYQIKIIRNLQEYMMTFNSTLFVLRKVTWIKNCLLRITFSNMKLHNFCNKWRLLNVINYLNSYDKNYIRIWETMQLCKNYLY